jgi:hypothetical protein
VRERAKQPKDIQQPQHNGNHHYTVQDRLDRSLHGNEPVDEPQDNSNNDQYDHDIDQWHGRPPYPVRLAIYIRAKSSGELGHSPYRDKPRTRQRKLYGKLPGQKMKMDFAGL